MRCIAEPPPVAASAARQRRRAASARAQAGSGAAPAERPGRPPARAKPPARKRSETPAVPSPSLLAADPPGHRSGYIAIVGKPNAGKSTLLNALVGQKLAIVTAKAQTTRHRILGITSGADYQALLVDTPGVLRETRNELDSAMMRTVRTAVTQADVLCAVVDAAAAAASGDPASGLDGLAPTGEAGGAPLLVLLNKVDLLGAAEAEELRGWYARQPGVSAALCASAASGQGVAALQAWLVARLPPGPSLYPKDMVSEHPERFFVAECVREQIFEQFRQEIPYCTTVTVLEHREGRGGAKDVIRVQVACERESQKPILLGRGGAAIKALSTASRLSIEAFLERPVFLEITVKTAENWRGTAESVQQRGYLNASAIA